MKIIIILLSTILSNLTFSQSNLEKIASHFPKIDQINWRQFRFLSKWNWRQFRFLSKFRFSSKWNWRQFRFLSKWNCRQFYSIFWDITVQSLILIDPKNDHFCPLQFKSIFSDTKLKSSHSAHKKSTRNTYKDFLDLVSQWTVTIINWPEKLTSISRPHHQKQPKFFQLISAIYWPTFLNNLLTVIAYCSNQINKKHAPDTSSIYLTPA